RLLLLLFCPTPAAALRRHRRRRLLSLRRRSFAQPSSPRRQRFLVQPGTGTKMVNAIKGLFISCDVPMAQFIVNLNASMPASEKFIVHMLDPTHMFVQPHVGEMIRSKIAEFRDQNSYEKPT
ncbi:hypothetical protein BRADI_2g39330v3, partial [Brachypodium distachyon]